MDFEQRMLDKFDSMERLIRDLCERTTRMETQLEGHFDDIERAQKGKERKFYYVIALMGVGFTIQEIIRGLL